MTTSAHILGIGDLLWHASRAESPEQRIKAADNALLPVVEGIGAVGDLLSAVDHSIGISKESLADTGYLLSFLAELVSNLQQVKDAAVHEQIEAHALETVS